MTAFAGLSDPAADAHGHGAHATPSDACLFCDDTMGFRSTSADAFGFKEHLATHEACAREYALWKETITEEWLGD